MPWEFKKEGQDTVFDLGRLLTALATAAAVLIGAALGVPALLDWEHLRAPAQARAQALLGAPVRIDGRISVQLLPAPRISLGNVVLERADGRAVTGAIARVRVHLSAARLLAGEIEPVALTLSGADLHLDRAAARRSDLLSALPLPLAATDGTLRFEVGGEPEIKGLTFDAEPAGRNGERQLRASGIFAGAHFTIRAVLRRDGALRSAALDFGEGEAWLSVAQTKDGLDLGLKLTRGERGPVFLGRLLPGLAEVVRPEHAAQLGPLAVKLRAAPEGGAFALHDVEVTAGPVQLTGSGRFRPGARPALDLELGARTLLLGGGTSGFDPSGPLRVLGQVAEWGGSIEGGLRLYAEHIVALGAVTRGGEIRLDFGPEGVRLQRFRLALPGGLVLTGQGLAAEPGRLDAAFRLEGAATGSAETPLTAHGRLVLSGTRALLQDVHLALGPNTAQAEAALFFGERTAFELRAEAGRLDLRPYGLAWKDAGGNLSTGDIGAILAGLRRLAAGADITARAELGSVRLTDATLRDGALDLTLDREQLVLRRLSVEEEGGRIIEARLRMPLAPAAAERDAEAKSWPARAEAAIEVRPVRPNPQAPAWRAGLWDGVLSLETEAPVRSRLNGRLTQVSNGRLHWTDIVGRVGKATIGGDLTLVPGAPPVLHGKLRVKKAVITLEGDSEDALWPTFSLADFWPQGIGLRLDWSADDLTVAGARLSGAQGSAVLEAGTARLVLVSGRLFGGTVSGMAALRLAPDGKATWESEGVVERADLAQLMAGGWQGRGLIRQSTSGSGAGIAEIITGLRGAISLNFEEGRIGGFDAVALAASLSGQRGAEAVTGAALEQAFAVGSTPFRRLEGEARIRDGEVSLSGISTQTNSGPIMLAGVISLPARLIAAQADIAPGGGAPLSVRFIGRVEAPERVVVTERAVGRQGE